MKKQFQQKIFQFIEKFYSDENLIIFTGSLSINKGVFDSDIDLILITENYFYSFTSKVEYLNVDYHVKVVPVSKVVQLLFEERSADSPVLCDMITKGSALVDKKNQFSLIKSIALGIFDLGPFALAYDREFLINVNIGRNLQVLERKITIQEKTYIIGELIENFTNYMLFKHLKWPYTPKKRFEQLEKHFLGLNDEIYQAVAKIYIDGNVKFLANLIREKLKTDGKFIRYSHTKNVEDMIFYKKNFLSIFLSGCENLARYFEISSYLLKELGGKYEDFYFHIVENHREINPMIPFLVLINADATEVSKKLSEIKYSFIQQNSKVNLLFPSNHMSYIHEGQIANTPAFSIYVNISKYLLDNVVIPKKQNLIPFLLIKILSKISLSEKIPLFSSELFNAFSQNWIPAAVDYSNSFNIEQISNRKIWLEKSYKNEGAKTINSEQFKDFWNRSDKKLDEIVSFCINEFNNITTTPKWFVSEYEDSLIIKKQYFASTLFNVFLIADNQKAYLYNLISLNVLYNQKQIIS